jgi:ankyrin repeat protein
MISRHFAFLVWLILMAVFVFAITASPKRRRWRWKLLLVIGCIWLVSAGFFIPGLFERKPFFNAVKSGEAERVKKLISENPTLVQSRTLMGKTALHLAVESGDTNMVTLLLQAGADVNAKGDSVTPLHLAAFAGHAQITETLLTAGAEVNAVGFRHDDTPLHVAALHGHANVVKVLLAHGAAMNAQNMLHKTPLQLAQENQRTNVIAVFKRVTF